MKAAIGALANRNKQSYVTAGRQTQITNALGNRTTWSYDDAGRTTVQRLANIKSDGTTLPGFDDRYDPAGNR